MTQLFSTFTAFLFTAMVTTNLDKDVLNPPGQLFLNDKFTIPNIHCVVYVHIFRWNPTSNDIDKIGGMTNWIQGIDTSQTFISYLVPVIGVQSDAW